jgi:hypothetical protein
MNRLVLFLSMASLVMVSTSLTAQSKCPTQQIDSNLPKPIITAADVTASKVSGKMPVGKDGKIPAGTVQVCVDQVEQGSPVTVAAADGTFALESIPLKPNQSITAVFLPPIVGGGAQSYSNTSAAWVAATANVPDESTKIFSVGGVEQAGYSSLSQTTNAFLSIFIAGPADRPVSGWGRIRLLSAPQPSTQGIVSVFTDPTGQLTTQDYTKVGQALDFVGGPELKFKRFPRWSLIADAGLTTPLNSQTVALTYVAPGPTTVECATLVSRFSTKNGYSPSLTQAPSGSSTCLAGGYTDIAFSNQDRSGFLLKYGGGFRTTNTLNEGCSQETQCSPSKGVLDLTFGQDEAVTRGLLRHVVFKLDGMIPIPTGSASFVYVFGSAYVRLAKNQDYSPLILQTASGVTAPSPTVIVLPLKQPDRDFYRLGVGLNLNQVFCKMFGGACPSKTPATADAVASAKAP